MLSVLPTFTSFQKYAEACLHHLAIHHIIADHAPTDSYRQRIGFQESDSCVSCGVTGDREHAVFSCLKFNDKRYILQEALGVSLAGLSFQTLFSFLLQDPSRFGHLENYLNNTLFCRSSPENATQLTPRTLKHSIRRKPPKKSKHAPRGRKRLFGSGCFSSRAATLSQSDL